MLFLRLNTFLCYAKPLNCSVLKKHERRCSYLVLEVFCSLCLSRQAGDILIVFIKSVLHWVERVAAVGKAVAR